LATLWKTATPSQYRMLRIIAGSTLNAAHAHGMDISLRFARSIAKRATGTLTAQWPEVLAAKHRPRQKSLDVSLTSSKLRGSNRSKEPSKGGRPSYVRRPPVARAWKEVSARMWCVKNGGSTAECEAYVRALQLLDKAQRELEPFEERFGNDRFSNSPKKG
jgi:hypothetical protein